jgi:hypothetical protein
MRYRQNTYNKNQRFWRWDNWQCYLVVIAIPVIAFPLYRFIQRQSLKNEENNADIEKETQLLENSDPVKQQESANKITPNKSIQAYAREVGVKLGTFYSDAGNWWDFLNPRGWTEDDSRVADIIIYQRNNYALMQKLYNKCYSNSRNLSNDLLTLLDKNELKRVQKYLSI